MRVALPRSCSANDGTPGWASIRGQMAARLVDLVAGHLIPQQELLTLSNLGTSRRLCSRPPISPRRRHTVLTD